MSQSTMMYRCEGYPVTGEAQRRSVPAAAAFVTVTAWLPEFTTLFSTMAVLPPEPAVTQPNCPWSGPSAYGLSKPVLRPVPPAKAKLADEGRNSQQEAVNNSQRASSGRGKQSGAL